jgi:hypothetical protein
MKLKFDDILKYIDVKITHYILYSQEIDSLTLSTLEGQLKSVIKLIRE